MYLLMGLVLLVMAVAASRALAPSRPLPAFLGGGVAALVLVVLFHAELAEPGFWAGLIGFVAILSALLVVLHPNPMDSVLFLILNLVCIALFYLMLQAQTLAALQIIVYAGAIMVLFVFVIMLLNLRAEEGRPAGHRVHRAAAVALASVFAALLFWALRHRLEAAPGPPERAGDAFGTAHDLGALLFGDYLFATEAASILLIAAMVGAVMLAKRRID